MIFGDIEITIDDDDADGNMLIASFAADSGELDLPPKVHFIVQGPSQTEGIDSDVKHFFTVDIAVLRRLCDTAEALHRTALALEGR